MSPEITYLKQLLDEEQWDKVLKYAEQLLFRGSTLGAADLAWINYATAKAKNEKDEYFAAIPPGELARKLAKDARLWDLYGRALTTLAYAYHHVRQYGQSLNCAYEFLASKPYFKDSMHYELSAWFAIGHSRSKLGEWQEAFEAFERAADIASKSNQPAWAYVARHNAVDLLYRLDPGRIPGLLAQGSRYIKSHPEDIRAMTYHLQDRAKYQIYRKRYDRAMALCHQALRLPHTIPHLVYWTKYTFSMLLAECHRDMGQPQLAMSHAMAARIAAIQGKLFHLEFEASTIIHELLTSTGQNVAQELDRQFLQFGVDLTTLLGDGAVKERSGFS